MATITSNRSLSALPAWALATLTPPAACDPFLSTTWFDIFLETCAEPDATPLFLAIQNGSAQAVAALRERTGAGRAIEALANFYTCRYAPLLGDSGAATASELADWLACARPRIATLRFENMRADDDPDDRFARALRAAGFAVQRFEQYGNWFEPVRDVDYPTYLARRDGQLRSTIERKRRRFDRQPGARLEILTQAADLERGLVAYLDVHARSWKKPEPFPDFIPAFVRRFGAIGAVRLGVAWLGDRPLAAQIWLAWGRRATIAKLAYVDDAKSLSPGTVLTAHMFDDALTQRLFDEIDLGRGDDPYKKLWLRERRPVHGLFAANLRSRHGILAAVRHFGPRWVRDVAERFNPARAAKTS